MNANNWQWGSGGEIGGIELSCWNGSHPVSKLNWDKKGKWPYNRGLQLVNKHPFWPLPSLLSRFEQNAMRILTGGEDRSCSSLSVCLILLVPLMS